MLGGQAALAKRVALFGLVLVVSVAALFETVAGPSCQHMLRRGEHFHMVVRFLEKTPRGRAGQASTPAAAGATLHSEIPLVSLQVNAEDVAACAHCLRPIGRITSQLQHAAKLRTPPDLFESDADDLLTEEVPCRAKGCGATFCSTACEKLAHAPGGTHQVLCCRGSASRRAAWRRFDEYAREQETAFYFFALAARIVASILARYDQSACAACGGSDVRRRRPSARPCHVCIASARAPWRPFCQPCWYDIVEPRAPLAPSADVPSAAEAALALSAFRASMREVAGRALSLLLLALGGHPALRGTAEGGAGGAGAEGAEGGEGCWLDLSCWGRLVGLARQNALEVEIEHPARDVVSALRAHGAGAVPGACLHGALLRALPTPLPNVEGAAIFASLSCLNHSCAPNAQVHSMRPSWRGRYRHRYRWCRYRYRCRYRSRYRCRYRCMQVLTTALHLPLAASLAGSIRRGARRAPDGALPDRARGRGDDLVH